MSTRDATILHADLDAFYASVEQLLDPSLRDRPIAVGGSVVLAASYEARAFGVRGGMPGRRARDLCPRLTFVHGHFAEYQRLGDAVIEVMRDFTPFVERLSIDEAFLDVNGARRLFGAPVEIARRIRARVREELGLPISVGVATTKHLAKVASQVAKPDGLVLVEPGHERAFLEPLPVELIWGVGPATHARLNARGITTVGELAAVSPAALERIVGRAAGRVLAARAVNHDARRLETHRRAHSVGAQSALARRAPTGATLRTTFGFLADRVAGRLRRAHRAGRTVTVRVRFPGLRSVTRSTTLATPTAATRSITDVAVDLATRALSDETGSPEITLLAVSVSQLVSDLPLQLELALVSGPRPPGGAHGNAGGDARRSGTPAGIARFAADQAVDRVRARFGRQAIGRAAIVFRDDRAVPDKFRELAERNASEPPVD